MRRALGGAISAGRRFYLATVKRLKADDNDEESDEDDRIAFSQSTDRIFESSAEDDSSALRLSRRSSVLVSLEVFLQIHKGIFFFLVQI